MGHERQDRSDTPPPSLVHRRAFLGGVAAGAGLIALYEVTGAQCAAGSPDRRLTPSELAEWKRALFDSGERSVYRSGLHPHAALPLGGIGCGNIYLDSGGHLKDWLIFNNLEPVGVPLACFAVRAQVPDTAPAARLLQTTRPSAFPAAACVRGAELVGEYPSAFLSFEDPALPVTISLEAFSPWAPPDSRASAYPGAIFRYRLRNPGPQAARVSLAALFANPVGGGHVAGRINELVRGEGLTTLRLAAESGRPSRLERPARLVTNVLGFRPAPIDTPRDLRVQQTAAAEPSAAELDGRGARDDLLWFENLAGLPDAAADALRRAVEGGATLLLSGDRQPLLNAWAATTALPDSPARPPIRFEDFESGDYARWQVRGTAFGPAPQTGTLEAQQPVSGWQGRFFVNTYVGGDGPRGRLTSRPFTIERRFIRFLIGGGSHPGRTCMNLVVNGQVVRTATGRDNERLESASWNVRDLEGRRATLEIVDEESGAWGHVNVDEIVFSDAPLQALSPTASVVLEALLPASFAAIAWPEVPRAVEAAPAAALPAWASGALRLTGTAALPSLALAPGGEVILRHGDAPLLLRRRVGRGQVFLLATPLAAAAGLPADAARAQAVALLCAASGNRYTPGQGLHPEDPRFGELCVSTSSDATALTSWTDPATLWEEFTETGRPGSPRGGVRTAHAPPGQNLNGALVAHATVPPGGEVTLPFLLTWHFPNYLFQGTRVGNRYATFWPESRSPARAAALEMEREGDQLRDRTEQFRRTIYDSTLPYWLLDCLTSQASTIRSEVCVWLADGTFAGYEGSGGCCPMNCAHVWGYEQSLAYLFPSLEENMREQDFKHQQRPDGGVNNRIVLPLQPRPTGEMPFADGHASSILKAYREHLNSPDDAFLREYWPYVRKAVEYLVRLDGDPPDGILVGEQWNTYDCAVYGPNSFIGAYYLAALRAGEEMAREMAEPETAARWRAIFESGRRRLRELCWNGEYFIQNCPGYERRATQYGPGCLADQLVGQWWAHQLGLGYLLPREQVRSALRCIFRYNWLPDMSEWRHRQRVFADRHDKGLLNCTWPKGGRPDRPILYCDEVWTGVEYQVAANMIEEGMLEEAFAIVRGARERYDGKRRNPWNEIECGGHYARALSSWSLLLVLSGFRQNGPKGELAFNPCFKPERFRALFSTGPAWGHFSQERAAGRQTNRLDLRRGSLRMAALRFGLPPDARPAAVRVAVSGRRNREAIVELVTGRLQLRFPERLVVAAGECLEVQTEW